MQYIFLTVIFTVYGQMVLKWRLSSLSAIPEEIGLKVLFLLKLLLDPFIASGFVAAFFAALSWMVAMTKYEISFAYPFMSLNFVLVLVLSIPVLNETFTIGKVIGLLFVISGLIISVKY